jgi:BON domain
MRKSPRSISIVLMSCLMGLLIACSHQSTHEKVVKDIQDKIAADPDTKESQVNVQENQGKITLTGKVTTATAQKKVEDFARAEPGQVAVENQTTVDPEALPLSSGMAAAPPPTERPKPQPIVVPSGTVLTVRTSQGLSSKTSQSGQTFLATLAQPVSVEGRPALPKGATVSGSVVSAKAKGKIKGEGELSLRLTSISVADHTYEIHTNVMSSTVKGKGKRTAATTGGGAAVGGLIGGLAGGGKGAGIGLLAGAGAGLIGGSVTGNKQIEIPAESALSFTLSAALTLPPSSD